MSLASGLRLIRAGFVLAREGALSLVPREGLPPGARALVGLARLIERGDVREKGRAERLAGALDRLGPTYVKFGQTLATRPDIVGPALAADLSALQDRMAPFDPGLVPGLIAEALGEKGGALRDLSPPLAAASIAQVHSARLETGAGPRKVAVKLLRPGIEARFADDLASYFFAARLAERLMPATRRLRPTDVVKTLDRSARLELDLRLEAAAISEFAANIADDEGFIVPEVFWDQTARTVLTTGWVDGIPVRDIAALDAAGVDRPLLARRLLEGFLRHAIRDGFFHADLHPGNLFADPKTSSVVAVDFGIMGRITRPERRFLAEILHGFVTRDYEMVARRHFEIGYVPAHQSVEDFALAIRAIGEPLHGRTARDISMARVLGQLFAVTELFDMQARPELVLLQKSMVLVEGVARTLDPELDIWAIAGPVVARWVAREAGPQGRIEALGAELARFGAAARRLPALIEAAEDTLAGHRAALARPPLIGPRLASALAWLGVLVLLAALFRLVFNWG